VRSVNDVSELVFASDSRLSGGKKWDGCPKIVALPRSDCMISFAGETDYAYPLMLQMINGINFHPPSRERRTDIATARHIALDVFNQLRSEVKGEYPDFPKDPGVRFIFGGYSWRAQSFKVWTLHYDPSIDRFTFRPANPWPGQKGVSAKVVAWTGDEDAVDEAKAMLTELLRERQKLVIGGFDMEPFEVLRDIIRSKKYPSIGGAPQVAKVYRSLQTQHFAVRWPNGEGAAHVAGRQQLEYEDFSLPEITPDSPEIHSRTARLRDEEAWTVDGSKREG
jgi:hypothetical protein